MTDHMRDAAQSVSMTWPKALNVTRHADNSWHGDISFARFPTDEELKALHEFLRVNHAGSAQPPAAPVETASEPASERWTVGKNGWDATDEMTREDI